MAKSVGRIFVCDECGAELNELPVKCPNCKIGLTFVSRDAERKKEGWVKRDSRVDKYIG